MSDVAIYPYGCGTATIVTGGEESDYKIENIQDRNINTRWQNDNDNEEVVIDFNFGSTIQPTYLALANHNLQDTSYGIKFQYGHGGVGGSFVSDGYSIGAAGTFHDYVAANTSIWLETFSAPSASQYFRLTIEDKNGTKPYISVVSFGVAYSLGANYSLSGSRGIFYGNEKAETPGGHIFVNNIHGSKKRFELSWDDINETDHDYWEDNIFPAIQGSLYPFFISDIDDTIYYVRCLNDELPMSDIEYQLYSFNLSLIQEN